MARVPAVYSALLKLVRPGEETVKFATEVLEAPTEGANEHLPTSRPARRCLGVISNTQSGLEEAAIVIFRRPTSPIIICTIPIYSDFKLTITQQPEDAAHRFLITLGSADTERFSLLADDMGELSDLIAEVKRLMSIAETGRWTAASPTHSWLHAYAPHETGQPDSQTLARFDTISSTYSQRISSPSALRTGLGAIDWDGNGSSDSSSLRESDAADQRGQWIVEQLQERESGFTTYEDIKIWCGTYNVNDQLPKDVDLPPWLADSAGAELLVFGFQELDLSTDAMLRYTPAREDAWREAIERGLGDRAGEYEKLHSRQLVGALMIIYVHIDSRKHVKSIASNSLATGVLGLMANKGAVAIRLRYKDSWLCFVNSHLAAFTNQTEARNSMYHDTTLSLDFPLEKGQSRDPWLPDLNPAVERPSDSVGVFDSHHLIWLGDLNYRIDLPREDVLAMVEKEEWEMLLRFDQLKAQRKHALAFTDFEEAEIDFAPTFKFDPETTRYDTSPKQRTPSWTDRIQWQSLHTQSIESLSYRGHFDILLSDHRPVSALLKTRIATVIPDKRAKLLEEVIAELDSYENESLPSVKIMPSPALDFGVISYLKPQTKSVEVHNNGSVIAQWSFVLKPGSTTLAPPWLTISPTSGLILPGEKSLVNFTIHVDQRSAPELNFAATPEDLLSELLILSIEKKDLFLAVSTRGYERTCFANSLARLGQLTDPIREVDGATLEAIARGEGGAADEDGGQEKMSIVRPAQRMLDWLSEHGLEDENLFLVSGDAELAAGIREALDTGGVFPIDHLFGWSTGPPPLSPPATQEALDELARLEVADDPFEDDGGDMGAVTLSSPEKTRRPSMAFVPPRPLPRTLSSASTTSNASVASTSSTRTLTPQQLGVASVADCLLRWLEALPEPLVTFRAYPRALRVEKRDDAYAVVRSLPAIHANLLIYLIAFLKICVVQTKDPKEKAARISRLAVVFSSVLFRPDPSATPDSLPVSSIPRRRAAFIQLLLDEPEKVNLALGK